MIFFDHGLAMKAYFVFVIRSFFLNGFENKKKVFYQQLGKINTVCTMSHMCRCKILKLSKVGWKKGYLCFHCS